MNKVLVTGGSGFVGAHVILQPLSAGHEVRTTVRSLKREGDVRAMLRAGSQEPGDRLSSDRFRPTAFDMRNHVRVGFGTILHASRHAVLSWCLGQDTRRESKCATHR
jgi:nucleoside-diphosphate-sugar epimerase